MGKDLKNHLHDKFLILFLCVFLHCSVSCIYFSKMTTTFKFSTEKSNFVVFFTVRFPLVKTLQLGDELFLRFLVVVRAFLACFIFTKQSIIFFELFFDTPTDDTLQYLLVIHQHLFHLKYPQPFPLNCDWERYLEFQ